MHRVHTTQHTPHGDCDTMTTKTHTKHVSAIEHAARHLHIATGHRRQVLDRLLAGIQDGPEMTHHQFHALERALVDAVYAAFPDCRSCFGTGRLATGQHCEDCEGFGTDPTAGQPVVNDLQIGTVSTRDLTTEIHRRDSGLLSERARVQVEGDQQDASVAHFWSQDSGPCGCPECTPSRPDCIDECDKCYHSDTCRFAY